VSAVGGESLEGAKNGCPPKETWSGLTRRAKENIVQEHARRFWDSRAE